MAYVPMPVYAGTVPLRVGQTPAQFSTNTGDLLTFLPDFSDGVDTAGAYFDATAALVDADRVDALASKVAALASETAASVSETNAEAAASVATAAAGLPPVAGYGQIHHSQGSANIKTSTFTAVTGNTYDIDTSGGTFDITMPASAAIGDWVAFRDYSGTYATMRPNLLRNGLKIMALAENHTLELNYTTVYLEYRNSTKGWSY